MIYNEDYFYKKILKVESKNEALSKVNKSNAYTEVILDINGKQRDISIIDKDSQLYRLQKNLLENFLDDIPLPNNVCGFVKGKSYLDFLKAHCSKKYYLRIDIKDFFNSINVSLIKKVLSEYIVVNDEVTKIVMLHAISNITTYNRKLPQGAVTSPQLSNIIFRRLDIRIRKYCNKFKIDYTRYADDMLFSSNNQHLHKEVFYKMLVKILKDFNLRINKKKIKQTTDSIVLNGYILNDHISLSRKKMNTMNSLLYVFENSKGKRKIPRTFKEYFERIPLGIRLSIKIDTPDEKSKSKIINYLAGYRSYLMNFSKEKYKDFCRDYSEKIKEIEKTLNKLLDLKV